jgi:hypothetical protein
MKYKVVKELYLLFLVAKEEAEMEEIPLNEILEVKNNSIYYKDREAMDYPRFLIENKYIEHI